MKKIYLLLAVVFCSALCASAKEDSLRFRKNAIVLNIPAVPRIYSLNYERVLSQKRLVTIVHIGFYHLPFDEGSKNLMAVFTGVDFLMGKKKHYLDLGAQFMFDKTLNFESQSGLQYRLGTVLIPKIGYRYQGKPKGFFFRGMFSPVLIDITPRDPDDQYEKRYFTFETADKFWHRLVPSLGLGYSF